jgi:transglutaminase-like putative cysteine protease
MLLKVTHQTDLSYSDLISESVMELRMAPRQELDQHRLSFTLAVGPPTAASSYFDWLGNTVHWFTVNSFHKQIRIVATSVVETDRPRPEPQRFKDTWPVPA